MARNKPTLEMITQQQINFGHGDPDGLTDAIMRSMGDELIEIVRPYMRDLLREYARLALGRQRRSQVAKITSKTDMTNPDIMLQYYWVPSPDGELTYIRVGEMTADDWHRRAKYLERQALGITTAASWCHQVGEAITAGGYKTTKDLPEIPPMPDPDDV